MIAIVRFSRDFHFEIRHFSIEVVASERDAQEVAVPLHRALDDPTLRVHVPDRERLLAGVPEEIAVVRVHRPLVENEVRRKAEKRLVIRPLVACFDALDPGPSFVASAVQTPPTSQLNAAIGDPSCCFGSS